MNPQEQDTEHLSHALTRVMKASHEAQPQTTAPPLSENSPNRTPTLPDAKWNAKWLNLRTDHHPSLQRLERECGRFCFEMWASPMRGRLLLLSGENGTGKSHAAKAVHRWVMTVGHGKTWFPSMGVRASLQSLWWHWPALLDELKGGNWDLVDDCFNVPCLVIDELGGGHDPSGVGTDKLCQILSRRENMWTLLTTNILESAWESKFDRRIASRFFRNSTVIDLSGVPDFGSL